MGRWFDDDQPGNDILHLLGLNERIKRMFDEHAESECLQGPQSAMGWTPPVDIRDEGECYVLVAELPGVEEDGIELKVVGNALVMSGERKPPEREKVLCYHLVERPEGPFRRAFKLPVEVDSSRIVAEAEDGVLIVELPKLKAPSQGQTIKVEVE